MIITCKKQVPARWIIFAILPWASFTFNGGVVGVAFLFSLKKFVENPASLTFILSLPVILSIVVAPIASILSDRIWTPVGRRKPFIIASWTGMLISMVLMPLMPNYWLLLGAYTLYNFSSNLNSPMEPLKQEIIPPPERGRATGAMTWLSNLATMAFYFIMLGRFDDVSFLGGFQINGEWVIYWSASLLLLVLLFLIMLGIRETDPKSSLQGQRLTVRNFFGSMLDRELWPVYLLVVGGACLNFYAGLGALSNLLYTDQWGYSKQEMGINVAIGGVINVFIIGLLTLFADRLNRMRAYQATLCLSLLGNIFYYCYVEFLLPDKRPTLVEIIVFGETLSILSILSGLLYVPLVYDYVRRNRMGTFGAGSSIVNRLATLITLNGVGLFVTYYALFFQPPAGEMTRVVLREENHAKQLVSSLQAAAWPLSSAASPVLPGSVTANVWQANGVTGEQGRTWEIRRKDKSAEELAQEKKNLQAEQSPLLSKQAILLDAALIDQRAGSLASAAQEKLTANSFKARISEISNRIGKIDTELTARAGGFREQVATVLGDRVIAEGDQVLGASLHPALLVEFPISTPPKEGTREKILDDLRRENSFIIDLCPVKHDTGYSLVISALSEAGADPSALAKQLQSALDRVALKRQPGLLRHSLAPLSHTLQTALTLDLLVVEEPVDTYISPITRAVNATLALFGRAPDPMRRLSAIARSLRSPAETTHVRAIPGPAARSISVTAVIEAPASPVDSASDAVSQRLASLLGPAGTGQIPQAYAFYNRIEKSAATQLITVAHPILASGYSPMRYDYMSGYLWMFVMGTFGIALTYLFTRLEAKGIVHKRGVEEVLAS